MARLEREVKKTANKATNKVTRGKKTGARRQGGAKAKKKVSRAAKKLTCSTLEISGDLGRGLRAPAFPCDSRVLPAPFYLSVRRRSKAVTALISSVLSTDATPR
jgi:hypothetical protein